MAHPGGRPLKFNSAFEIESIAEDYFQRQMSEDKPITITGLCIALGTFRDVLMDYQSGKYDGTDEEFSNAIKRAKLRCEEYAENQLFTGKNPASAIFALKNYGWKDRQELEHSGSVDIAGALDAARKRAAE